MTQPIIDDERASSPLAVLAAFTKLGLTSFGGPVAHLAYFRIEFVERRRWLGDAAYADIVALCQVLPGPASSQVGLAIGLRRAGLAGALAAWIGFTAPSALLMLLFAYGIRGIDPAALAPGLHGLRITAVAVVALAVWSMARSLAPDRLRASIAVAGAALALAVPTTAGQIGAILGGGLIGWAFLKDEGTAPDTAPAGRHHGRAILALVLFAVLLFGLPILAGIRDSQGLRTFDAFYRTGSLVFGGGHVVLPLLRAAVVEPGWVGDDVFLAGYGLAQAVPGPLFSFATYLGAVMGPAPNGWAGGLLALAAIYLPSFLLVIGLLPFWDGLRRAAAARSALRGINAAVVGLLLAALYSPGWTTAIRSPADFALGLVAFLLLAWWKLPPWLVVILGAGGGYALALLLPG